MKLKKKSAFTLLEIMIVIFMIGLIGSVVGYNIKGSLEKGKVFKSREAEKQVYEILMLVVSEGTDISKVVKKPAHFLKESGLVKDPDSLLKDGWNKPLEITLSEDGSDLKVQSKGWEEYKNRHN